MLTKNKIIIVMLLSVAIALTAYVTHVITLNNVKRTSENTAFVSKSDSSAQINGENNRKACTDTNLMLDQLPQYIKENEYALNLLRKECSFVLDSFQQDIDSDGVEEVFMQTTSLFCGAASCKTRQLYIVDADETLFSSGGYDSNFEKSTNPKEFSVVEQIKYWKEHACCSSKKLVIKYRYSQDTTGLFETIETLIR